MIDFRYHVVSIVAVFIALAVGILLGSGPLKEPIDNTIQEQAEQLRTDRNTLREEIAQGERQTQYYSDFTDALAPTLIGERLAGRAVVLVTVPGADTGLVDALTSTLEDAGGQLTGTVGISESMLDPANEAELDDLATQLVPPGTSFEDDETPRERANTVLARSMVTSDPDAAGAPDADAQAVLAGLEELDYLDLDGEPSRLATLALVVAPPAPTAPAEVTAVQNGALVDLVAALDGRGEGTLVAGPIEAAAEGGLVGAVRAVREVSRAVSTVDSAHTAAGRVTVVLGLAAERSGNATAYGYGPDADAVLPDLAPAEGEDPGPGS